MQKLVAVEEAKTLMNIAKEWSIWRWLMEKRRVRATADAGTAALNEAEKKVKAGWNDELRKAYREVEAEMAASANPRLKHQLEKAREAAKDIDPKIKAAAQRVKEADDLTYESRMEAERTFDEAERRLSASMAREGASKAIEAYDVHEKAIRRAEAAAKLSSGTASLKS
jgi:hypothetical protein